MKKNHFSLLVLLCAVIAVFIGWAGLFYYKNLRGVKPAITKPPYDIATVLPLREENASSSSTTQDGDAGQTGEPVTFPLVLPPGFRIEIFAKDVPQARALAFDDTGNLWVSQTRQDRVTLLETENGVVQNRIDSTGALFPAVSRRLAKPHGLAFDPNNPSLIYIAEEEKISRIFLDKRNAQFETIAELPNGGIHRNHFTRTIGFGPDGRLYVSIGSSCNVCKEDDPRRAAIYSMNPDGSDFKLFASGLRNTVFFAWHPKTGELWGADMGRDELGDDLPPDEINIIREGYDYGWPLCYGKNVYDDAFDSKDYETNPCDFQGRIPSHIDLPAHVAPLGLAFIPKDSAWPKEYWGDLLIAYHGSWNSTEPVGYKVARIDLDDEGNAIGQHDFITGWLQADGAIGRPVGLLFLNDTLYISDDHAGVVYAVTYQK